MPKDKRFYRYKVTHVWGCMKGRLKVGATLIYRWNDKSHTWLIPDGGGGKVTGSFSGELIGRVTEPDVTPSCLTRYSPCLVASRR